MRQHEQVHIMPFQQQINVASYAKDVCPLQQYRTNRKTQTLCSCRSALSQITFVMAKKSTTPLRTSPCNSTSKYASTSLTGKACVVGKKKNEGDLLKKVSKSAVDQSPADIVGKKHSNWNEEFAVLNRGKVAERQKQKGTIAAPSGGNKKRPGNPKEDEQHLDDGSDKVLEDHEEKENNDGYDYEGREEEEVEDNNEESQEAVVKESFNSSSADKDPDIVMDHEHDRRTDVGTRKRKRGDWAGLSATHHAVVAPGQTSRPTSHTIVAGGASSIPTGNTVGGTTDAALPVLHLDGLIKVQGMSKTESIQN